MTIAYGLNRAMALGVPWQVYAIVVAAPFVVPSLEYIAGAPDRIRASRLRDHAVYWRARQEAGQAQSECLSDEADES